jgi:hypothetical protein
VLSLTPEKLVVFVPKFALEGTIAVSQVAADLGGVVSYDDASLCLRVLQLQTSSTDAKDVTSDHPDCLLLLSLRVFQQITVLLQVIETISGHRQLDMQLDYNSGSISGGNNKANSSTSHAYLSNSSDMIIEDDMIISAAAAVKSDGKVALPTSDDEDDDDDDDDDVEVGMQKQDEQQHSSKSIKRQKRKLTSSGSGKKKLVSLYKNKSVSSTSSAVRKLVPLRSKKMKM